MFKQAVIFAGGRGERLKPLTDHMPKPMAPINGRPFVDYLLKAIYNAGITRILFLAGYRADAITNYYGNGDDFGLQIEYSIGTAEDMTGRRLLNAYQKLDDHFLLLYGDNYWPVPLDDMEQNYRRLGIPLTTTVFSNINGTGEYGFGNNVIVEPSGKVKAYDKQRRALGLNGIDIGFFLVDKNIIDPNEPGNISFEETILARQASEGKLGAYVTDEQYYYITTLGDVAKFEQTARNEKFPFIQGKAKR